MKPVAVAARSAPPLTTSAAMARAQLDEIDARIARLQVVWRYVAAVAGGDMTALNDPECGFLVQFLAAGRRRRA